MTNAMRRRFLREFWHGIKVVWPILSGLLAVMAALGIVVALLEDWPVVDGLYFAFVSGLTIGYGDLAAKGYLARALAVSIGLTGILFAGLIAALGVHALQVTLQGRGER